MGATRHFNPGGNMRIQTVLLGIWITSCAAPETDGGNGTVSGDGSEDKVIFSSAPITEAEEAAARDALLSRIDATHLRLAPMGNVEQSAGFDAQAVEAALETATGSSLQTEWAGTRWMASGATHQASYDVATGELLIADAATYERALSHAPDAQFLAHATALFGGLAQDSIDALVDLKHLGVTERDFAEPNSNVETRIGTKVFAMRRLGGLRVAGNRMVASYKTDGTLRTVRGRWPSIDLAHSTLSSNLSQAEVVQKAIDTLIAAEVRSEGQDPIRLESFYELREGTTGWIAVLRAAAINQTLGSNGEPGRIERHDFDL